MISTDIERLFVQRDDSIAKAARIIRHQPEKIALVVDEARMMVGTVTDALIRKALLSGIGIEEPLSFCMYETPDFGYLGQPEDEYLGVMAKNDILQLPLFDAEQRLQAIAVRSPEWQGTANHPLVVIMAGGLGTRLAPLTDSIPKPMIEIDGKPLLELIVTRLKACGFRDFALSVNYMADVIENHFGDGSDFGISVRYIRETKRMGTAGSLSLASVRDDQSVLVTNGDILTGLDYGAMMTFHTRRAGDATIAVNTCSQQIPYGVVTMNQNRVTKIEEKPIHKFLANSANYIVQGGALKALPRNEFFDMPDFLNVLAEKNMRVMAFPLHEYWQDVGNLRHLESARKAYAEGKTDG